MVRTDRPIITSCNTLNIIFLSLPDASTASVSITVTDFNDEIPTFVESTLVASVAEESEFGTTITTLRVSKCEPKLPNHITLGPHYYIQSR